MFKSQEQGRRKSRPPSVPEAQRLDEAETGPYFHRVGVSDLAETKECHDDLMSVLGLRIALVAPDL
jgi:hypothetical protein